MQLTLTRNRIDSEAIEVYVEIDGKYILISVWDEAILSDEDYEVLGNEGEIIMNMERV